MKTRTIAAILMSGTLGLGLGALPACSTYHATGEAVAPASDRYTASVQKLVERDPGMHRWFDTAYGYAVFPRVAKGAVGIGGARGDGAVYEQGKLVGYAVMDQATVGWQLGGQAYAEVIFFENKAAMDKFQHGQFALAAQASAVAAADGASADADYTDGVAVFTMPQAGLMFEASIGGQTFSFRPST